MISRVLTTSQFLLAVMLPRKLNKIKQILSGFLKYHLTAAKFLKKYFHAHLTNPITRNYVALGQIKQIHASTSRQLKNLIRSYSKVVANIDPTDGMDKVMAEIDRYQLDDDVSLFDIHLTYEEYRKKVGELTEGSADWRRYEILPLFTLALGVKFNSNGEVERSFSRMNNIHQNRQRNTLSHDCLDHILHIQSAVEGKSLRENYLDCKKPDNDHCHCSTFLSQM